MHVSPCWLLLLHLLLSVPPPPYRPIHQEGKSIDVRCTNDGARLVTLSCTSTLDALVDELRAVPPYGNTAHQAVQELLMRYWHGPLTLPRVIKDEVRW